MAKHEFCTKTFELQTMIDEGNDEFARREVVKLLNEGFAKRPFLRLVATMLDRKPKASPGRPSRLIKRWFEIGQEYEVLYDPSQKNQKQAVEKLADRFGMSERNVERALKYYREAVDTHREATWTE